MNALRHLRLRRLAIAVAILLPVGAWATSLGGGLIVGAGPRGEGCRLFWGESVDRVAWSPSGEFLAVTTTNTDGLDSGDEWLRVFRWPGMELMSFAIQSDYNVVYTIDDAGVAGWLVDAMAMPPVAPAPRRLEPGGVPADADNAFANRPATRLRVAADLSAGGILAFGSAPISDPPVRLCVEATRDSVRPDKRETPGR
jgi:hypothetical protein